MNEIKQPKSLNKIQCRSTIVNFIKISPVVWAVASRWRDKGADVWTWRNNRYFL